ncbi:protein Star-like [Mizuhopecten yessoensis]|uniref:protein Star-like n=1 Tax=Mizuhopecten yessoensis TaxID=6573 RepID=UPI000B45C825|nr:protein Star-like [Mizuhopecten yessoensis]
MADMNSAKVDQAEPRLVELIRDYYIEAPSLEPYNLDFPNRLEYSNGQTPLVDSRLNYMEGGFYVECGGLNGEKGSNTLFFEKVRKWNGLLIEGDPSNYAMLKSKHRKAFSMNACLYPYTFPAEVNYHQAFNLGRIMHAESVAAWNKHNRIKADPAQVQCFPIYSVLLAMNRTTVDFFSLDIEGDELGVLKTIPFEKVDIKMLAVEYSHGPGGYHALQTFMEKKGYETLLKMSRDDWGVNDLIFRKRGLKH